MLSKAILFATDSHQGQTRKTSNLPYIVHPLAVASNVRKFAPREPNLELLMTCALLHDVVEDCQVSVENICDSFDTNVAKIVAELTSDPELVKSMGKTQYLQQKMVRMSDSALLIKLCDRLDNISDAPTDDYLTSTLAILRHLGGARVLTRAQLKAVEAIHQVIERHQQQSLFRQS